MTWHFGDPLRFDQLDWMVQKITRATKNMAVITGGSIYQRKAFEIVSLLGNAEDVVYWCPNIGQQISGYDFDTVLLCKSFDVADPYHMEWFNDQVLPHRMAFGRVDPMPK